MKKTIVEKIKLGKHQNQIDTIFLKVEEVKDFWLVPVPLTPSLFPFKTEPRCCHNLPHKFIGIALGEYLTRVEIYDPLRKSWSSCVTSLPTQGSRLAVAAYENKVGAHMANLGGYVYSK
ncbi:unnamed protein product [Strongylus vulgaris]|uniref:Kelch repeat protein n=1 Tax=Strongylus vulgaris TaxID=40348 RepID=A0A3P7LCH5_STRVU|nr:unnamed protein product [Strongylus vulgaris]